MASYFERKLAEMKKKEAAAKEKKNGHQNQDGLLERALTEAGAPQTVRTLDEARRTLADLDGMEVETTLKVNMSEAAEKEKDAHIYDRVDEEIDGMQVKDDAPQESAARAAEAPQQEKAEEAVAAERQPEDVGEDDPTNVSMRPEPAEPMSLDLGAVGAEEAAEKEQQPAEEKEEPAQPEPAAERTQQETEAADETEELKDEDVIRDASTFRVEIDDLKEKELDKIRIIKVGDQVIELPVTERWNVSSRKIGFKLKQPLLTADQLSS